MIHIVIFLIFPLALTCPIGQDYPAICTHICFCSHLCSHSCSYSYSHLLFTHLLTLLFMFLFTIVLMIPHRSMLCKRLTFQGLQRSQESLVALLYVYYCGCS